MNKLLIVFFFSCNCFFSFAQETSLLLKQAYNYERQLKEPEALEKYKLVLINDSKSIVALIKTVELNCTIGERTINKTDKRLYFESALSFAERAVTADSIHAKSWYALALACSKMTITESDNKKAAIFIRDMKLNADKALSINPNDAMANFIEGKWHYDMITLNWAKRLAIKTLFSKLPDADIDLAIEYLEKCKRLDQYFMLNYWVLANAYKIKNRPEQQIETLQKLVKLPIRTFDDTEIKSAAQKMLDGLE